MSLADGIHRYADKVEAVELALAASHDGLRLLGTTELAELAGVTSNTVASWRHRGRLPAPVAELACGPIWLQEEIEAWLASRG